MQKGVPELPNAVTVLEKIFKGTRIAEFLKTWENPIFSLVIILAISAVAYSASRRTRLVPARLQAAFEIFVGGIDDFVCGIIGPAGRRYTPFIGTLFLYILIMNLSGLIPLMKAPTTSWSTTLALAICVFIYVQYAAVRERGLLGYIDYLLDKPRGIVAFSVFIPLMLLIINIVSQLVRPISLSLRLRSNIWGDDMLIAVLAGFGLKGVPLLFFNFFIIILASIVQAVVFCLLTTIYFALALSHEEA
ncbi:MAG: F0F1 ATP synthase subunit A [Candidatus Omnitrophica bacterium]|nr:F0F1 ATP synthase subunit A [Candidatus Omnitrophota bacterium]